MMADDDYDYNETQQDDSSEQNTTSLDAWPRQYHTHMTVNNNMKTTTQHDVGRRTTTTNLMAATQQ